jgi:site-specific DNA recombinase
MLTNPRYVGRWEWNARKWTRVHATGKRRHQPRPAEERTVREMPELAIIPASLWEAAQTRLGRRKKSGGRPRGSAHVGHMLSGLLQCGTCGSSFAITGSKKKAGVAYYQYGCAAHASKGTSICSNGYRVSEKKLNEAVARALHSVFEDETLLRKMAVGFAREMADATSKPTGPDVTALDKKIRATEQRIKGASRAIAEAPADVPLAPLYAQLRDDQDALADLRQRRAALDVGQRPIVRMPTMPDMRAFGKNLLADLEGNAAEANAALRRAIPSPVLVVPEKDGAGPLYRLAGTVQVAENLSCGGRI